MTTENEYYESDFGYKKDQRCRLDDLNDEMFFHLEEFVLDHEASINKIIKISVCFSFLVAVIGVVNVGSCQADVLMRPIIRSREKQKTELLKPVIEVIELAKVVKIRPRGKGRRLGGWSYMANINTEVLLELFGSQKAKKALKLITESNLDLRPQISPIISPQNFFAEAIPKSRIQYVSRKVVSKKLEMSLSEGIFSFFVFTSVGSSLILPKKFSDLGDLVPLPPGSRLLFKVLNRARKYFLKDTLQPKYKNGEAVNEFDMVKDFLSSAAERFIGGRPKNSGSKGNRSFSFLPGTIVLFLLGIFKRKSFETAISSILETSGLVPKKTYWGKLTERFSLSTRNKVYVVIAGSVIVVLYLNREKIFATVASVKRGDAITLGFDHLNGVFGEYTKFVRTTVDSAHKLSGEAFTRLWRQQDVAAIECKVGKQDLDASRQEIEALNHKIYTLSLDANNNVHSGESCQKELTNLKIEVLSYQDYESNRRASQQNLAINPNPAPNLIGHLPDKVFPADPNTKARHLEILEETKRRYPITSIVVAAPPKRSEEAIITQIVITKPSTATIKRNGTNGIPRWVLKLISYMEPYVEPNKKN